MGYCPIIGLVNSFTEIVETWGRAELASAMGVPKERARQWSRDNSIPQRYWKRLLAEAVEREFPISPDLLIDLAAKD